MGSKIGPLHFCWPESKFHGIQSRRYDKPQWFTPSSLLQNQPGALALAPGTQESKFPGIQSRSQPSMIYTTQWAPRLAQRICIGLRSAKIKISWNLKSEYYNTQKFTPPSGLQNWPSAFITLDLFARDPFKIMLLKGGSLWKLWNCGFYDWKKNTFLMTLIIKLRLGNIFLKLKNLPGGATVTK